MIAPDDRVLAGVSGGADSACLLLVLKELAVNVAVAHLNHGLRGTASDEDEEFTRQLAERCGVPFFRKQIALKESSCRSNLEAEGRAARKSFFNELALRHGFTKIALAHNRTDRVETFFLNLFRGSGSDGLVAMAPVSGNIIRPLIDIGRDEVEAYLTQHHETWRTDATNFDLSFARNRLRHVLLPQIAAEFNPNWSETLARTVQILEDEDTWMRPIAAEWLGQNGTIQENGFTVPAAALETKPTGMVRRVIRLALRQAGSDLRDVSFEHVEHVRALLESGKSGKLVQIPGGLIVTREFDRLVFRPPHVVFPDYEYELQIPGEVHIPEVKKVFRAEITETTGKETGPDRVFVDAASVGPCVRIRNWKPGDYYRSVGLPGGKVKKLFQRARIPRSDRKNWPVVVSDSTIVWVASFPVSRQFAAGEYSQRIVVIEALPV